MRSHLQRVCAAPCERLLGRLGVLFPVKYCRVTHLTSSLESHKAGRSQADTHHRWLSGRCRPPLAKRLHGNALRFPATQLHFDTKPPPLVSARSNPRPVAPKSPMSTTPARIAREAHASVWRPCPTKLLMGKPAAWTARRGFLRR